MRPISKIRQLILDEEFLLFSILMFASFLRFWKINEPNLFPEFGLLTYDMIKTLKPYYMVHRYQGPMMIYILVPSLLLWNNVLGFRITTIVVSILTILLTYLFTKKLYSKKIALITCFILAAIPIDIFMSRLVLEVSLIPFFVILTLYLFLKYLDSKNDKYLYLIFFVIGLGTITKLTYIFFLVPVILTIPINPFIKSKKFFREIPAKKWAIATIALLLGSYPMIYNNLTNDFETLRLLFGSYPETQYGGNMANFKENAIRGFFVLFPSFIDGNMLDYYPNLNYSKIVISSLFLLLIFDFIFIRKVFIKKSLKRGLKDIKTKVSFVKNDFYFVGIASMIILMTSTLTVNQFSPRNFSTVLPFVVILMGRAFYEFFDLFKELGLMYYIVIIITLSLLTYNLSPLFSYFSKFTLGA